MKKLDYNELSLIQGGSDATDFFDGVCTAVGVFGWLAGPAAPWLIGGCTVYGIYRLAQ